MVPFFLYIQYVCRYIRYSVFNVTHSGRIDEGVLADKNIRINQSLSDISVGR